MAKDVTLTIDGISVTVPAGTLLVEAAKKVPVEIPVYCYHEKLGPAGLCRVCLVEVEGMPKLQIGCNTAASDGMVVHTTNGKVDEGRRAILEFFLLNHPLDCPICDKGGECDLQDYVVAYGQDTSRVVDRKESKPKAVDLGPTIVLDEERCIVCQRCVRFEDIITRERELVVVDRGAHDIIATATDQPYRSQFSGNVTELCPVGALTSKTYRFLSRPWDNHRTTGSCSQCAVGCAQHVDVRHGVITRTMSVPDDEVSDGWLCDRGRYTISYENDDRRLRTPLYKQNGEFLQVGWDDAIAMWAHALRNARDPEATAAIGGARLTNQESFLLQHVMRAFGTPHLDWRSGRGRQALAGRDAGSVTELGAAQAIIIVGVPPSQTAPVLDLHIRKAVFQGGATLVTVGALASGSFVPEERVEHVGDARAKLPKGVERIALVWDGIDAHSGRELAALAADLAKDGATVRTYIAGSAANGSGAEAMGMHPRYAPHYEQAAKAGMDAEAIYAAAAEGKLDVLSLHGANPILTARDGALVRAALERVPFVVVTDLFHTQTTEFATLVLPIASAFERRGHLTNTVGLVRPLQAALPVPEGLLTDGEVIGALAEALSIGVPSEDQVDAIASKPLEAGRTTSFTLGDERLCGAAPALAEASSDLRLVVASHIFAGGGTTAHDERIATLRPQPSATFAPATAARSGLRSGMVIDLVAGDRALRDLIVQIDPLLAEDCVAVIDGLPQAPANLFTDGAVLRVEHAREARELAGAV